MVAGKALNPSNIVLLRINARNGNGKLFSRDASPLTPKLGGWRYFNSATPEVMMYWLHAQLRGRKLKSLSARFMLEFGDPSKGWRQPVQGIHVNSIMTSTSGGKSGDKTGAERDTLIKIKEADEHRDVFQNNRPAISGLLCLQTGFVI